MTERLYYRDSYLTSFDGLVVSVEPAKPSQSSADSGRDAAQRRRSLIVLDQTAFYPTSGGQPHDTGTLGDWLVVDVLERPGASDDEHAMIVHVVEAPSATPATPLTVSQVVVGKIDWPRRLDHLQQHSGQHVLSQAFNRACQAPTVSFHLGDEYCTIDVARNPLDAGAIARAEALANETVLANLAVRTHFVAPDDLPRFNLRKPTARAGEIRVIEITDFDASACGGTHVALTGQIGPIKIRRWERRGDDTRVEFVCGWRALRDYGAKQELVRGLADAYRVREADLLASIRRDQVELASARDALKVARERLLGYEAAELLAVARTISLGGASCRVVSAVLADRSLDDVKSLARKLVSAGEAVALLGLSAGERGQIVFAQSPGLALGAADALDLGGLLKEICGRFGGRGGGARDLAQGGVPDVSRLSEAIQAAVDSVATGRS